MSVANILQHARDDQTGLRSTFIYLQSDICEPGGTLIKSRDGEIVPFPPSKTGLESVLNQRDWLGLVACVSTGRGGPGYVQPAWTAVDTDWTLTPILTY